MGDTIRSLATTLAIQALVSMAVLTLPVLAPTLSLDTGIPAAYVGVFIALVYGASMASSLVSGGFVRRLGAIRVSQACLALVAAGLLLAVAGSPGLFVVSALLMGAGYGAVTPASSHILARTTPPQAMSLVVSLKQTGVPLGGVLAGLVVPPLVGAWGWRPAIASVAGACLATVVIAQPLRRALDADREPERRLAVGNLLRPLHTVAVHPELRRLAFCSFFFSSIQLCLVTYLVTYLATDLHFSLVQAGVMLSVAQAAGVVARVAWGALADRGRPLAVLAALAGGMALGALATGGFSPAWPAALIGATCVLFGATAIGWNGVFLAEVARRAPRGQAVEATGGALSFTYLGVLVAPPVFGVAVEHGLGYPLAYVLLALPALASGALLLRAPAAAPVH